MNFIPKGRIVLLTVLFFFVLSSSVFAASFTIKASASPKKGGSISPSGKVTVEDGNNQQFTITPSTGYEIKDVKVDGVSQGKVNIHTFVNVTRNHSIKAQFIKKSFTVTITQGGKVKVSPKGTKKVTYGKVLKLKIKPDSEDVVPILLVNGKPVEMTPSGTTFTYSLIPAGDTSVHATSEVEPKVAPAVKVMDEATALKLTSVSSDGTVLTFNGITPYLESLHAEDVIVSNILTDITPHGLLRKVTSVAIAGSQVTVETTLATFEDVIEEGVIIINKTLTANDIASFVPLAKGVTFQEPIPGPVQPMETCFDMINVVLYDADGNHNTTNDQITLDGSACIDPDFNLVLERKYGVKVKNFVFSVGMSESLDLQLTTGDSMSFNEERELWTHSFNPVCVSIACFVPRLTVYVGAHGSLSENITAGVKQTAGLTVGLQYSDGDWSRIKDSTSDFTFNLPALRTGAWVNVYVRPEFDFMLCDLAGPYAHITGYFDLQMDPWGDPWLSLYGGLKGGVGAKVDVPVIGELLDKKFPDLIDYRKLLVQLAGNQPPTISNLTANLEVVGIGGNSTITVAASDPEGDPLTCTWEATGGSLSSTTDWCKSVIWTAPYDYGTYTISVSVTDDNPRHSPVTRDVTIAVGNQPPKITSLTPESYTASQNEPVTMKVKVSDPDGDPLTCTWSAPNGGTLSSTTDCSKPAIWTAPNALGTYTVKVSVTDNKPGHSPDTKSASISVSNQPPTITSLEAKPSEIFPGQQSTLTLVASDPNGDRLTCAWTVVNGGSFDGGALYLERCGSVTWTAPNKPGTNRISVTVTDGKPYGDVTRVVDITVKNRLPDVSLSAEKYTLTLGESTKVTVQGSDPDGDAITCTWSAPNGGTLSSTTDCSKPAIWTAPGNEGSYNVTVKVTDNKPGHLPVEKSLPIPITVATATGCVTLRSPANNYPNMDNGCHNQSDLQTWSFSWDGSACTGATEYNIQVKGPSGTTPLINAFVKSTSYTYEKTAHMDDNLSGWQWKVSAKINGYWTKWSDINSFTIEPPDTDCNYPPDIISLTAVPQTVLTSYASTITVEVYDRDDLKSDLKCAWTKSGGNLNTDTGCGSVYFSAQKEGTYVVTVSVTDGKHSPIYKDITITVNNRQPEILSLNGPNPTSFGKSYSYTVSVVDMEGDSLSCTWSANGGTLSHTTTNCMTAVTWTAPWVQGTYTISVIATDNKPGHGSVSKSKDINVFPPPPPGRPGNVSASDGTWLDRVRLTWTMPTEVNPENIAYYIYRSTSNDYATRSKIAGPLWNEYQYDDFDLKDANTYWYWVTAYQNHGGEGQPSASDSGFLQPITLTVQFSGNGWGQITGPGILCGYTDQNGQNGTDCSEKFKFGAFVTLTSTGADINNAPDGWSGCDSSTDNTCTINSLTSSRTVTADFYRWF